jgi:hypothetical protein
VPEPGPETQATLASVREELAAGHDVRVLSPLPGAAHEHDHLVGVLGAWALLRRARRYDGVVLHVEPGLPLRVGSGRLRRVVECAALSVALSRFDAVTVHFADIAAVPGSVGGRTGRLLWRSVTRAVVRDEADRWIVHEHGGVPLERIEARSRPAVEPDELPLTPRLVAVAEPGPPRWHDAPLTADEAMAEIRMRAAARRAAAGPVAATSAAARALTPPPPAPPGTVSMLTRAALKRALGSHAPAVGAAARRMRARVARSK